MDEILTQPWKFMVTAPGVKENETVFITGSTPELGEWDYNKIVFMEQEQEDLWTKTVIIPNTCEVSYRYGFCVIDQLTGKISICHWETSLHPRILTESVLHPTNDAYGVIDGNITFTRGWLTYQTLVQFKFMDNPLKFTKNKSDRNMYIKVTPLKLSFGDDTQEDDISVIDSLDSSVIAPGVVVEVSTLDNDPTLCTLQPQEQFGRLYRPKDVMVVNMTVPDHKSLAYLVDFYSYSTRAAPGEPPCYIGYTYVLPNMFKPSQGILNLPITGNVKYRPVGSVNIEYLIIYPIKEDLNCLKVSYAKFWSQTWIGMEVGHRGLGASFKAKGCPIRENTIASLRKAAASGADILEFDVQLSKDMVPIIYHDFHVCISMKRKKELEYKDMLEVPVKDLTLDQLQKLKVYHLVESRSHDPMFFDEDLEDHQPFPSLQHTLEVIDIKVGFNVELKWSMELKDGTYELENPFDMNTYVDKVLEVILTHAGDRRIVFSCFHPDICTMVRNKQNKYPVMFLTVGVSDRYEPYRDPRCATIPMAVQSAVSTDILGIVVHTEDLLRDPSQVQLVKDAGLVIFCWGDDNNDKNIITKLKDMGLHAVIYDKLDEYTTKTVKESIFLVDMRESQRVLMQLKPRNPCDAGTSRFKSRRKPSEIEEGSQSTITHDSDAPQQTPAPFLDLVHVRRMIHADSTATSLASLASADDTDRNLQRQQEIIASIDKESQLKEQPERLFY